MAPKRVKPVCRRVFAGSRARSALARQGQHQARVDAVRTGRDAVAAAGADRGPSAGLGVGAALEEREDAGGQRLRVGGVEASGAGHGADFGADAAGGAAVEDIRGAGTEGMV
ncbi:MAG: hypothetical protein ACJ8AW_46815 [Rhodopila sp.]